MMRGSQARSSLPQGWSQTVESRINIGLDKERDFPRSTALHPRLVPAAIRSFWDHIPVNVHTFIRRTLWLSTLTNLRNT